MVELDSHVAFFDRLVELIPAKHYLADPDDRVDLRHMKKREREAAREEFKKQHRETKKALLNPATAKGTLELQREKEAAREEARSAGGGAPADVPAKTPADREALRAKLQARLEEMRKQRKADESEKKVESAKAWRDSALEQGRKKAAEKRKAEAAAGGRQQQKPKQQRHKDQKEREDGGRPAKQQRTDGGGAAAGGGLAFSKVDFGGDVDGRKGKKKKLSKAELLKEAERRAAAGPAPDEDAWDAALKRAQGDKVLDDPRLLRKSIKKETKLKQKKTAAWEDRAKKVKEEQEARQNKRRTNLQRRVDAKKDAKKAKREKKLLRAGFEGRKSGFIATPGPKK